MKTYRVEWSIDVDADGPEDAALEAADLFREGNCPFFEVIEQDAGADADPVWVNIDEVTA